MGYEDDVAADRRPEGMLVIEHRLPVVHRLVVHIPQGVIFLHEDLQGLFIAARCGRFGAVRSFFLARCGSLMSLTSFIEADVPRSYLMTLFGKAVIHDNAEFYFGIEIDVRKIRKFTAQARFIRTIVDRTDRVEIIGNVLEVNIDLVTRFAECNRIFDRFLG